MLENPLDPEKVFDEWCLWESNCKMLHGSNSPANWDERRAFVDACNRVMAKYGVSLEKVLDIIKAHRDESIQLQRQIKWCENAPQEMYAIFDELTPFDLDDI